MAKKAGRPKGSCIPEGEILDRVADRLITGKSKTPNQAIMNIYHGDGRAEPAENFRRRLSRKWKAQGTERLAAAHDRVRESNRVPDHPPGDAPGLRNIGDALRVTRSIGQVIVDIERTQANILEALAPLSEASRRISEQMQPLRIHSSGLMRAIQEYQNNSAIAQMRTVYDDLPAIRVAHALGRISRPFGD